MFTNVQAAGPTLPTLSTNTNRLQVRLPDGTWKTYATIFGRNHDARDRELANLIRVGGRLWQGRQDGRYTAVRAVGPAYAIMG